MKQAKREEGQVALQEVIMPPYSIFMMIFAAAILIYAAILAVTKDEKMLPLQVQVSLKQKNRKEYISRLSKCIAIVSLAPAAAAVVGIWSEIGMLIAFVVVLILCLWIDTRLTKDLM